MRVRVFLMVFVFLVGVPSVADPLKGQDEESRLLSDQFSVSYGWLTADFDTTAQIGFGGIVGTFIRLESELELDENLAVGWMNGVWQFNRRHAIEFGYGKLDRSGSTVLDTDIEFEGIIYQLGGRLDSEFKMGLLRTQYQYSFFNNGKAAGGISAGLSTFDFDLGVVGAGAIVGDEENVVAGVATASEFIAPLPSIGFYMHYAINPRTILRFRTSALDVSVSGYDAKMLDTMFTIDWFFAQHFALGGGFVSTDITVARTDDDPFKVQYAYSGLLLQITIALP